MGVEVHRSTITGKQWAIRAGAGKMLRSISKSKHFNQTIHEIRVEALQSWKLVPPPSTSHYRSYEPSLYQDGAGPGTLGYTNFNPPSIDAYVESLPSIGIPIAVDLNNGTNVGGKHELSTLNPISQTRVSSYVAFWDTIKDNPKFEVITFGVVEKILFDNDKVAHGVEYTVKVDGEKQRRKARARKEVILSAGTLQTPQVLMLSVGLHH